MRITKNLNSLTTTQTEMAKILGITQQRVSQLVKNETLIRDENGSVFVVKSLHNFYKSQPENTENVDVSFAREKALHEKANRELAELELAEKRGDMHCTADIELTVGGLITVFKKNVLDIPSKMAPILVGKTAEDIKELLTQEGIRCLTELSRFDANKLGEVNDDEEEEP
jgi:predicted transcriptional regulator